MEWSSLAFQPYFTGASMIDIDLHIHEPPCDYGPVLILDHPVGCSFCWLKSEAMSVCVCDCTATAANVMFWWSHDIGGHRSTVDASMPRGHTDAACE